MGEGAIRYEVAGHVARVTIDHAIRHNAMSFEMWKELSAACAQAAADRNVRVLTLTGAGDKAFCAGADISQFGEKRSDPQAVAAYDRAVAEANSALANLPKPSVALIRGICFGGGMGLAMACDIRLAAEDSRYRIPAARLGLGYSFANIGSLVTKLGPGVVADILFSARILSSADAHGLGVVQAVYGSDIFSARAEEYVRMIAGNAPLTLAAVKRALIEMARPEAARDAAAADALVAACFASADYREGQAAFREKREPRFRGE